LNLHKKLECEVDFAGFMHYVGPNEFQCGLM
jgi:hypothetical protein